MSRLDGSHRLAAAIGAFGGADLLQLRQMPLPQPRPGEIVVRVDAAAVNPIDTRRRAGYGRRMLTLLGAAQLPLVLGNDFAGTVCAVGKGVTAFREGDTVFGAKPPSSHGTHATHVAVDARHAVHQPAGMSAAQLAALPYNFLTVRRAFDGAGIRRETVGGRQVLVHGASGGLGRIALGLLHAMGAEVTAVAGATSLDDCCSAGAALALDHTTTPLRSLPACYAASLNFASWDDEPALLRLLAPGAAGHATTVHPLLGQLDRHGVLAGLAGAWRMKRRMAACVPKGARYQWAVFRPVRDALLELADCAPLLAATPVGYPLSDVSLAHRHVEQRRPGRAILLPQSI